MASFESTKSDIVSSSLGQAVGLTASNTWAQIVTKIKAIVNRGTLNWSGSNTTKTVEAGYYPGGTLDSRPSYNNGYNAGVTAADNRSNPNSTNYKTGYNAGVAAADARVNTGSASYTSGYNAGYSAGSTLKSYSITLMSSSTGTRITFMSGTTATWYPITIPLNFTHRIVGLWVGIKDGKSGEYYQANTHAHYSKAGWNHFLSMITYSGIDWETRMSLTVYVSEKSTSYDCIIYYV